jgi:hypothetical protein
MRNLALTLVVLMTVSFGAFAATPQNTFEMHCMQCHNGKRELHLLKSFTQSLLARSFSL